jgi:hypothetical protein
LKSGVEAVLLTIRGDMLLGDKDYSLIDLKEVIFAEKLIENIKLIDGYITLNICTEGNDRFLITRTSSFRIKNNPTNDILNVECKVLEKGKHSLEIVDILGKTEIIKEWYVGANSEKEFEFDFPVFLYGNGGYFLILNTPTDQYIEKFVIRR